MAATLVCAAPAADREDAYFPLHAPTASLPEEGERPRFSVQGTDPSQRLVMYRWAQRVSESISALVGVDAPWKDRRVTIVIRDTEGEPDAFAWQRFSQGVILQELQVQNLDAMPRDLCDTALARLIVMAHLNTYSAGNGEFDVAARAEWIQREVPRRTPAWLCRGIARALHPGYLAEDHRTLRGYLERGNLPGIEMFFNELQSTNSVNIEMMTALESMGSVMVDWLAGLPEPGHRFGSLFAELAKGGAGVPWFVENVPGCLGSGGVEKAWKARVAQLRIIEPGLVTPDHVEALEKTLRISREDVLDVPGYWPSDVMHVRDLTRCRTVSGIRQLALNKIHALRLVALGRNDAYRKVVNLYCKYLDGFIQEEESGQILLSLREAEAALMRFKEDVVRPESPER